MVSKPGYNPLTMIIMIIRYYKSPKWVVPRLFNHLLSNMPLGGFHVGERANGYPPLRMGL